MLLWSGSIIILDKLLLFGYVITYCCIIHPVFSFYFSIADVPQYYHLEEQKQIEPGRSIASYRHNYTCVDFVTGNLISPKHGPEIWSGYVKFKVDCARKCADFTTACKAFSYKKKPTGIECKLY
jgi:hypothetical protein